MEKNELFIRSIKIVDIAYISAIYATIVISISVLLDKLVGPIDEQVELEKSIWRVILESWLYIGLVAISAYIVRNLVEKIPFPLDGYGGFVHSKVKELGGGPIYGFLLFFYARNLRKKIEVLINRVTNQKSIYN